MPIYFDSSWLTTLLSAILLIAGGAICIKGYLRNRKRQTLILETLRFVIIAIICILLLQPEWIAINQPKNTPEISILWDDSASMNTQDVEMGQNRVITRKNFIKELLDSDFDQKIKGDNKIKIMPFSSEPAADSKEFQNATTDIATSIENLLSESDNIKAIVLLSDGSHNADTSPISAVQKMRKRSIPLYCIPVGSPTALPDIAITSVQAPTYGIIGEMVQIPFTVKSTLTREIKTRITLKSKSDNTQKSMDLKIPAHGEVSDSILWKMESKDNNLMELSIPAQPEEIMVDNNTEEFSISGREEAINVLMIESLPRWEYRFIRNALYRDPGVKVNTLMIHPHLDKPGEGPGYLLKFPESLEDLSLYDVVFLGDIGLGEKGISKDQAALLKGLVANQASGIVFLPGPQGNQIQLLDSELSDLMPVVLDRNNPQGTTTEEVMHLSLTSEGRGSLLTLLADNEEDNDFVWKTLPGFNWFAPALKAKAGSQILAVHSSRKNENTRLPLIVTKPYGNGKVLFMGIDSAWRWRKDVEDKYHYRFWSQVARWMSYRRNMAAGEHIRLMISPERPTIGNTVNITAIISDEQGAPLVSDNAHVDITDPSGNSIRHELVPLEDSWGSYSASFKINQSGTWNLKCVSSTTPDKPVGTSLVISGGTIEKQGQPIDQDLLNELAAISRGKVLSIDSLDSLIREVRELPVPPPQEKRITLWSHPVTMAMLILLMSAFWIGRKLNGTI